MIELKISNGKYLTHKDLEIYLNEFEDYYNSTFQKGMLEYEWKEFIYKNNNEIEKSISEIQQIELIIKDIKLLENHSPVGRIGEYLKIQSTFIGDDVEESIVLRGNEEIGSWEQWKDDNNLTMYTTQKLSKYYTFEFQEIKIKETKNPPYKKGLVSKHSVPNVSFIKLTTDNPVGLKKGDKLLFNLNIINRTRFKTKEEFIHLEYIEKVNLFPPVKQSSNSNCFVVTTTMGDTNHPIVVDFRKYRDEVLLQTDLGRLFIKLYYKIGPSLSFIIKKNKILFKLSKGVILKLHQKIS